MTDFEAIVGRAVNKTVEVTLQTVQDILSDSSSLKQAEESIAKWQAEVKDKS